MEKGSFRRRLQEGADNLPSLGALSRAFSDKIRQLDVKQVARIMGIAAVVGVPAYALYEVSGLFSSPTPPPRAADNPNFAGPTALSLRPKVSEAVTADSLGIEQYDQNHLEGRISSWDSNTFMNKGIASCKTGVALGLESEQTILDMALSFISPTVAEAAPLEAESPEDLLRCVQDIEKQRLWFSRFNIKVNQWNRGDFMGVQSIKEWRQELAGEIRKKGFDMTPEEMGSFIGDFIPVAIVDPITGKVGTITLEFVDDKAEADRRGVHWTGENMAMFFDDPTDQIAAVLVNQDPLKKCHNGLIPFAPRAKEAPPTKTAVPPTPTTAPPPAAFLKVRKFVDEIGKGIFIGKKDWQFRIRSVDDPDCRIDEFHSTNDIGELIFPVPAECLKDGKVRMEVDEDTNQFGLNFKAVRKSQFQFAGLVPGVTEELEFFNVPVREEEQPGQPAATPTATGVTVPTSTPTVAPTREATATPQVPPIPTPTPTPEAPPTPTPTTAPTPTLTPVPTREATATPHVPPIPTPTPTAAPAPTFTPIPTLGREPTATPQTRPAAPTATPGSAPKPEGSATPAAVPQAAPSKEPSRVPSQPTAGAATPSAANPTRESIATPTRR